MQTNLRQFQLGKFIFTLFISSFLIASTSLASSPKFDDFFTIDIEAQANSSFSGRWLTLGSQSQYPLIDKKFPVPQQISLLFRVGVKYGSLLPENINYQWVFLNSQGKQISQEEGQVIYFSTTSEHQEFKVQLKIGLGQDSITESWAFLTIGAPPKISILQPSSKENVLEVGKELNLVANGLDALNFPAQITWISKMEGKEFFLGRGDEMLLRNLDAGVHQILAKAVGTAGQVNYSDPITVTRPYKVIPTKIVAPNDGQIFDSNEIVAFVAEGNEVEYAFDESSFKRGTYIVKRGFSPGPHIVSFKGKHGMKKLAFYVRPPSPTVAFAEHLQGRVLVGKGNGTWENLRTGESVFSGQIIQTRANSSATLSLKEGGEVSLKPEEAIRIDFSGKITRNFSKEQLVITVLSEQDEILQAIQKLKSKVNQFDNLLEKYKVGSISTDQKQDVNELIEKIRSGEIVINEIVVE